MIEFLWSEFLSTMPSRIFAYIPFLDHLRVSRKLLAAVLLLVEALSLLCTALLMRLGISVGYANLAFLPLSLMVFFSMVKMDRGKVGFMYIFTMAYTLVVRGISGYLSQVLFAASDGDWPFGVMTLAVFLITMPFMVRYVNRTAEMVFETEAPGVWRTVWMLPLFSVMLVLVFTHGREYSLMSVIVRAVMMAAVFLVYYFVIDSVRGFQKHLEREEHIRRLEEIQAIHIGQYAMLQAQMEETRRARHDLRQHLMAIQGCIDSGDMGALSAYVQDYGASLPPETMRTFCKNYAVDAVLRYYAEKAMAIGADVDISFEMTDRPVIPEPMLCVLMGNLLENALHACEELEGARFIRVMAKQTGESMLSIAVDNSAKQPLQRKERLLSTKQGGTGTGTESVRIIAERFGGEARFHWQNGVFYASVMLNPPIAC